MPFCVRVYLHITTTIVREWLNSFIYHDDNKCITANGYTIIYVGTDYSYSICHVTIIHLKFLGSAKLFKYAQYSFGQCHMIN